MRLTEEKLKEILRQQPARSTPRKAECLAEDQFMRAALGEISSEERRALARHLITCADCTEEYRALRSLKTWAEESQQALAASARSSHRSDASPIRLVQPASRGGITGLQSLRDSVAAFLQRLIWQSHTRRLAAVALLVVVAGGSLIIWQSIRHNAPPISTERARVSIRLSVEPADRATISEAPEKLVWSSVEHAITYRVVLYDFQSTPIWESSRLRETSATLPESVRQRLQPGQPYYWRVIAEDAIDQRQSELFQFTLTADERR